MTALLILITIACAVPVLVRALCIVTRTTRRSWPRWQHLGFALGAAVMAAGALAVLFGRPWAAHALLAGVAALIVFDRRRHRRMER